MTTHPLVTIIIACYNHEKYVVASLNSILEQDYPNKQIVIIDDGSKDSSVSVIQNWIAQNDSKIVVKFRSRPNKGLCATINEAMTIADGDYFCMLASDDLLLPGSITKRIDCLLAHPGKLVVIGDAKVIDSDGKITMESAIEDLYYGKKINYSNDESLMYSVLKEWSVPGPVMIADRKVYDIIGPYPEDLAAEDLNFYLQVIGRKLLIFLDEAVALYRVHDANTCRLPQNGKKIVWAIFKSYYNNRNLYKGKYRKIIMERVFFYGKIHLRNMIGI